MHPKSRRDYLDLYQAKLPSAYYNQDSFPELDEEGYVWSVREITTGNEYNNALQRLSLQAAFFTVLRLFIVGLILVASILVRNVQLAVSGIVLAGIVNYLSRSLISKKISTPLDNIKDLPEVMATPTSLRIVIPGGNKALQNILKEVDQDKQWEWLFTMSDIQRYFGFVNPVDMPTNHSELLSVNASMQSLAATLTNSKGVAPYVAASHCNNSPVEFFNNLEPVVVSPDAYVSAAEAATDLLVRQEQGVTPEIITAYARAKSRIVYGIWPTDGDSRDEGYYDYM